MIGTGRPEEEAVTDRFTKEAKLGKTRHAVGTARSVRKRGLPIRFSDLAAIRHRPRPRTHQRPNTGFHRISNANPASVELTG